MTLLAMPMTWSRVTDLYADTQTAILLETASNLTPIEDIQRRHPFGGIGKPENVARFAVVLASDDAAWVTGACHVVDGGYTAR